jgi:hypothetical protein
MCALRDSFDDIFGRNLGDDTFDFDVLVEVHSVLLTAILVDLFGLKKPTQSG